MADNEISSNKIKELSQEVLHFSRDCLMVNLRFMDAALSRLTLENRESLSDIFATDGVKISYNPRLLLKAYQEERTAPTRDYLHTVFHCVFGHIFMPELVDVDMANASVGSESEDSENISNAACSNNEREIEKAGSRRIWDLACDIAVEYAITGLGQSALTCMRQQRQEKVFANLAPKTGLVTAEKIYKYYMKNPFPEDELEALENMFHVDGHSGWKFDETTQLKDEWLAVSRRMQIDMETFARRQVGKAGAMMESLRETNRETSDYGTFLKTFAVKGDGMKLDPNEFDMVTYSYGMRMSGGKVPLIEPTEYKDSMRVRDFVLAIETADMDVDKIRRFVKNTWEILHSTETFFSKVRLHILDGNETLVSGADALDEYLEKFNGPSGDCIVETEMTEDKKHAPRGVDSRAVFNRVSEMRRQNKFKNLRGLLLFTDTEVIYPANMPAFKTAFIFANDDYSVPQVPAWGIRQVLELDSI